MCSVLLCCGRARQKHIVYQCTVKDQIPNRNLSVGIPRTQDLLIQNIFSDVHGK